MATKNTHIVAPPRIGVPTAEECPVLPLWPDVANIFGIGRSQVYKCAANGDFPVIKLGGRLVAPVAPLRRMLGLSESRAVAEPSVVEPSGAAA